MRDLLAIAVLFYSVVAYGAINVPAESEPYEPIVAQVESQIPDGASFNGGWEVSEGCKFLKVGEGVIHLWACPGEHSLKYSGYWVHTKEVTFKDGDGNTVTIQSFLGSGFVNEEAGFKVLGSQPDPPDPDDPGPKPGQKYQIVFFVKSENLHKMPEKQKELVTSLIVRRDLSDLGNKVVQVIDDDMIRSGVPERWTPWIEAVMGDPLPRVALAPIGGGAIQDYPLPSDWEGLVRLLGGEE